MQGDRIAWELGRKKIPINRKCNRNLGFPGGSDGEESAYNAGDLGSILEMKISSAISINKKCHGHQQFLASKCEWELTKLRSRWRCHAPCWLLRSWGKARSKVRKETGLAQTPEVHMKRMNSMSPEACILPSCSVQFSCSVAYNSLWPHGLQHHRPPCPSPNSQSLLKLTSMPSVMPSNHLILCLPLLLPPSIFPSIRVFTNKSVFFIRWPKYWNFSFSISAPNEYSGLISFWFLIEWLNLPAVKRTLKSFLHTTVQRHQFFGAQLSF